MKPVTSKWLSERGGLHDAEVRDARRIGSTIEITFSDEWANERGLSLLLPEAAGTLTLTEASTDEGDLSRIIGGWISDIELQDNRELCLQFCDREPVVIRMASAAWTSTPNC